MDRIGPPPRALEEAERWFVRLQAQDRTRDEREAFQAWLQASDAHRQAYADTERLWRLLGEAVDDPEIEALPEAAVGRPATRRRWRRGPLWAAAAAAAMVGVAIGLPYLKQRLQSPPQVFETAVAQIRSVTLADGSRLTLDAQSRIAVQFSRRLRQVRVERGTAFFEVKADAQRPLVATTGLGTATVLGTQFQVSRVGERMEVVLTEGSVKLGYTDDREADDIVLKPGERAELSSPRARWATSVADLELATAWRRGRLIFRATTLADALERMNRYQSRPLRIGDPALRDLRISGVFRTDDPDSFVLALQHSYGLRSEDTAGGERILYRTRPR